MTDDDANFVGMGGIEQLETIPLDALLEGKCGHMAESLYDHVCLECWKKGVRFESGVLTRKVE